MCSKHLKYDIVINEVTNMSIADNIKYLRKRKNITQKQLAEASGLAVITIQQYEAGKYEPKIESLYKLSNAFGCNINELTTKPWDINFSENDSNFSEERKQKVYLPIDFPEDKKAQLQTVSKQFAPHENRKTIILDTTIAEDNIVNTLLKKLNNGEQLTDDEFKILLEHAQYTMLRLTYLTKELGESLAKYYLMLNEAGQKKANEEINRAISQIEMLAKIPEYRNDTNK